MSTISMASMARFFISSSGTLLRRRPKQTLSHDGEVREEGVVLEDGVDRPLVGGNAGDRLVGEEDLALGRLIEAGDHAQRGRLAAAGRAEHREELALLDLDAHVLDGDEVAERLGDVLDLDVVRHALLLVPAVRSAIGLFLRFLESGCCYEDAPATPGPRRLGATVHDV